MERRISVIVPVYNCKDYIERCIMSIINQTYDNIEVIIVDDGSNDGTEHICDHLSKLYKNVITIHQPNKGPAQARNKGISRATGYYITFVDADDWLLKDDIYQSALLNTAHEDIVVFGIIQDYGNGHMIKKESIRNEMSFVGSDSVVALNTIPFIDTSCCNKIFKRSLFSSVKFPTGCKCEDNYIIYKLFNNSKMVKILPIWGYCYYERENSRSREDVETVDYVKSARDQKEFFRDCGNVDVARAVSYRVLLVNIETYERYIRFNVYNKQRMKEIVREVRNNIFCLLNVKNVEPVKRLQFLLFAISPRLFGNMYKHKIRRERNYNKSD